MLACIEFLLQFMIYVPLVYLLTSDPRNKGSYIWMRSLRYTIQTSDRYYDLNLLWILGK